MLLSVISIARARSGAPLDATAIALQEQAEVLVQSDGGRVRGARIVWAEWMHEFYAQRSFKPAWTDPRTSVELLRALEDSRLDGLDPNDYHLSLLEQLRVEASAPAATDLVRAQFDLLQTDALLRLGYHLLLGKVDPESFDAQWNYVRTLAHLDAGKEIEAALASADIYARVEALKPKHPFYLALKNELRRYREAAATTAPALLPDGPTLKVGMRDARVPVLRMRLAASGEQLTASPASVELFDAELEAAVRRFQERMGLAADGAVGAGTRSELNVSIEQRILTLRVNLDRGRLLLHDLPARFVVVNIASYLIYAVSGDTVIWKSRAQVGTAYQRTPIFRSHISYLVFNPTWTVPPGIIERDILPAARRDPQSITRRGLHVLDRGGRRIDPATIDWSQYRSGHIPYTLRQEPGPDNSMGRVKFMFPNSYSVYLHDTPAKQRFAAPERPFSSGCVRVENPLELAQLLLADPNRWNDKTIGDTIASLRTQNVTLKERTPVLLTYWTAFVDEQGRANFRRDIYGQDALWAAGLNAEFRVRKRPLFDP